tara:strand:+ start:1277 stop:1486 length:210 start_codon:yes stop_codon:yes gene_type:complete
MFVSPANEKEARRRQSYICSEYITDIKIPPKIHEGSQDSSPTVGQRLNLTSERASSNDILKDVVSKSKS